MVRIGQTTKLNTFSNHQQPKIEISSIRNKFQRLLNNNNKTPKQEIHI